MLPNRMRSIHLHYKTRFLLDTNIKTGYKYRNNTVLVSETQYYKHKLFSFQFFKAFSPSFSVIFLFSLWTIYRSSCDPLWQFFHLFVATSPVECSFLHTFAIHLSRGSVLQSSHMEDCFPQLLFSGLMLPCLSHLGVGIQVLQQVSCSVLVTFAYMRSHWWRMI